MEIGFCEEWNRGGTTWLIVSTKLELFRSKSTKEDSGRTVHLSRRLLLLSPCIPYLHISILGIVRNAKSICLVWATLIRNWESLMMRTWGTKAPRDPFRSDLSKLLFSGVTCVQMFKHRVAPPSQPWLFWCVLSFLCGTHWPRSTEGHFLVLDAQWQSPLPLPAMSCFNNRHSSVYFS